MRASGNFVEQNFVNQKFSDINFFDPNLFWPKFLGLKLFWPKFFLTWNCFGLKFCWLHIFLDPECFNQNIFWTKNKFAHTSGEKMPVLWQKKCTHFCVFLPCVLCLEKTYKTPTKKHWKKHEKNCKKHVEQWFCP